MREVNKRWKAANPEKVRQAGAAWYLRHRQAVDSIRRERRRANPIGWRIYRLRQRGREYGAAGDTTLEQLEARISYYGSRCWMCGGEFHHIDHVIPLARGGSNWPANLRPACYRCNGQKHTRTPRELAAA